MLKLRFAEPHERAPRPPADDSSAVHIWWNRHGGVVARGFRQADCSWMAWPYLATYRFSADSPFIDVYPESAAPVDVIWDTYRRSVLPMAMQVLGWEALHASAVVSQHGIVAFCASSETGKSTVAYGLRQRGFAQWSDDAVVFQTERTSACAVPLPFQVRLRPASHYIFGRRYASPSTRQENTAGEQIHTEPLPLATICLLRRAAAGVSVGPEVGDTAPASAYRMILAHAHEFNPFDVERRQRMLAAYLDLVASVRICEITFAPVAADFDRLLDAITDRLDLQPSTPSRVSCLS